MNFLRSFILTLGIGFTDFVLAGPLFVITPIVQSPSEIVQGQTGVLTYTVSTELPDPNGVINLPVGVSAIYTQPGDCSVPTFTLTPQSSCLLRLQINSADYSVGNTITGEPLIDNHPELPPSLYTPLPGGISVSVVNANAAGLVPLNITNPITLVPGTAFQVTIQNMSHTTAANAVNLILPTIIQNQMQSVVRSNNCDNIPPTGTCQITLTAKITANPSDFPVQASAFGSNTTTPTTTLNLNTGGGLTANSLVFTTPITQSMQLTNTSTFATVQLTGVSFSNTNFQGVSAQSPLPCQNILPMATCQLPFTALSTAFGQSVVDLSYQLNNYTYLNNQATITVNNTAIQINGGTAINLPTNGMIQVPILNSGNFAWQDANINVTLPGLTSDYTACTQTQLAPGSSCNVTLTTTNANSGDMAPMTANGTNINQVTAPVNIIGPVTANSVIISQPNTDTYLTLTNTSSLSTASISSINLSGISGVTYQIPATCQSIPALGSCQVPFTGDINAYNLQPGNNGIITIGYSNSSGSYQTTSTLSVDPTQVTIPTILLAPSLSNQVVTLTNSGNFTWVAPNIVLLSAPLSISINSTTCNLPIAPGNTCTVNLTTSNAVSGSGGFLEAQGTNISNTQKPIMISPHIMTAVGFNNPNSSFIYSNMTADGSGSWTQQANNLAGNGLADVTWNSQAWVAVGFNMPIYVSQQSDGSAPWNPSTSVFSNALSELAVWNGTTWLNIGGGTPLLMANNNVNGTGNWNPVPAGNIPFASNQASFCSGAWSGQAWVVVGLQDTTSNRVCGVGYPPAIISSTDTTGTGLNAPWMNDSNNIVLTPPLTSIPNTLGLISVSWNGSTWMISGTDSSGNAYVLTNPNSDATGNWTLTALPGMGQASGNSLIFNVWDGSYWIVVTSNSSNAVTVFTNSDVNGQASSWTSYIIPSATIEAASLNYLTWNGNYLVVNGRDSNGNAFVMSTPSTNGSGVWTKYFIQDNNVNIPGTITGIASY